MNPRAFFRDHHGRVAIAQWPNPPLIVWFIATVLARLVDGTPGSVADLVAFGALFTWAWLELWHGDAPFRRALGAVVLVWSIWSRVP